MEEDLCCYVYAIVRNQAGLDPPADCGIDETRRVRFVSEGAIAAAVSDVSPKEFGDKALLGRVSEAEWVNAKAQLHLDVLAKLAAGAVLPMRFFTIFRDEAALRKLLKLKSSDLLAALDRLEGKEEWAVKVYCKLAKPDDSAVEDAMADSFTRLAAHSEAAVVNPPRRRQVTGRSDEMILNAAYLVARDGLRRFRSAFEALAAEREPRGFVYEISGPWPPYNFVDTSAAEGAAAHDRDA